MNRFQFLCCPDDEATMLLLFPWLPSGHDDTSKDTECRKAHPKHFSIIDKTLRDL